MRNNNYKKGGKKNYSNPNPSTKLLKALKNITFNQGGTVSYVFVEDRIKFTKKHPLGIVEKMKSTTSSTINPQIFHKEVRGKLIRRSPQEIIQVFENTKNDLGASYYVIN